MFFVNLVLCCVLLCIFRAFPALFWCETAFNGFFLEFSEVILRSLIQFTY